MAAIEIEVFREDVDELTKQLLLVIGRYGSMPYVDRCIVVSAALANAACTVDAVEEKYSAGCTHRLKAITADWK